MTDIEDELRRRILAERATQPLLPPDTSSPPEQARPYYVPGQPAPVRQSGQNKGGLAGALAAMLLLFSKLKFLLIGLKLLSFGNVLLTSGTMLLSMWAYAQLFGWPFGIGMVLLIFVHECGHALAARMRGIPSTMMVFVPFMGAAVFTKRYGKNIAEDAFIGIMGPVVGTVGAVACVAAYFVTGAAIWLALAEWGFFVNLFNLTPTVPLDGGWIAPLFSPKLLAFGVVLLLLVGWRNPLILILGLVSIPRIIRGWRADPATQPYYRASAADRWKFGTAYFGLAAFLGIGVLLLRGYLRAHYPAMA